MYCHDNEHHAFRAVSFRLTVPCSLDKLDDSRGWTKNYTPNSWPAHNTVKSQTIYFHVLSLEYFPTVKYGTKYFTTDSAATCARCGGIFNNRLTVNYRGIFRLKNFENRLTFDRIMATSSVCSFLAHPVFTVAIASQVWNSQSRYLCDSEHQLVGWNKAYPAFATPHDQVWFILLHAHISDLTLFVDENYCEVAHMISKPSVINSRVKLD